MTASNKDKVAVLCIGAELSTKAWPTRLKDPDIL